MGRKPKEETVETNTDDRKSYLKKNLIEHIKQICPEPDVKFDTHKICQPSYTRGSFRNFLKGDFFVSDLMTYRAILSELKAEKFIRPIFGKFWARV